MSKKYLDEDGLRYLWQRVKEQNRDIVLGETSTTAYPGNKGKANADAIAVINSSLPNKVEKTEFNQRVENLNSQIETKLNVTDSKTVASTTDKYSIKFENGTFKIEMTNKQTQPITGEGTKVFELSYKDNAKWNGKQLATIDDLETTVQSITIEELNNILV